MTYSKSTREELALRSPRHTRWSFRRRGFSFDFYTPKFAQDERKKELGFQIRIRDPRCIICDHHYKAIWPYAPNPDGEYLPFCSNCKESLPVKRGRILRPKPLRNWRVFKLYMATTASPSTTPHGVFMIEACSHLTDSSFKRLTTKVFVRFKMGFGGPLI